MRLRYEAALSSVSFAARYRHHFGRYYYIPFNQILIYCKPNIRFTINLWKQLFKIMVLWMHQFYTAKTTPSSSKYIIHRSPHPLTSLQLKAQHQLLSAVQLVAWACFEGSHSYTERTSTHPMNLEHLRYYYIWLNGTWHSQRATCRGVRKP